MTTMTLTKDKSNRQLTFEDLKGLRAEGYIRDSTVDQKDGYGPDLQRKAIETFASNYGLRLGGEWYTDFITGTSTLKRSGFQQALAEAHLGLFDVLLVYHTSRFARNRADAIRYKQELRRMGITVVFVSQGIISGNDNDFLNEGINEVLDEHYSRNLSRWIGDGLRMKHEAGVANGKPPLGYRSEKLENGKRERKVPDPETMPVLVELLRSYATGEHSYYSLATHLNSLGYGTRLGRPFTKGSVETVLTNRFYEGKAVYHPGKPDEEVRDGAHEVPREVKLLWDKCQEIRLSRSQSRNVLITREHRFYPLSGPLICDKCGLAYHGKASKRNNGRTALKMEHNLRRCETTPTMVAMSGLHAQFSERVLPHLVLDDGWKQTILRAMDTSKPVEDIDATNRVSEALARLRKLYLWQDISDEEYARQRSALERELRVLESARTPVSLPNLDGAARLLNDLPTLWQHPGTTDHQRQEFSREVFEEIRLDGREIVAIKPHEQYVPLFAYAVWHRGVIGVSPTPVTPTT